jgi:hypothetical protein
MKNKCFSQDFVKNGGGLIVAGQAWYWSYNGFSNTVHYANGYPGNKYVKVFFFFAYLAIEQLSTVISLYIYI